MRDLVGEYRQIQASQESSASLDRALKLTMRIASGQGGTKANRWIRVLKPRQALPRQTSAGGSNPRRLRNITFALSMIPKRLADLAEDIPDGQYSLLMDTLLLIFHEAYFVLLPEVVNERESLLQVFRKFSSMLALPQDRFQVLGLVELEEKRYEQAAESFRTALAATHADAHDFMTRVQLLWTVLMENGRYVDALESLLDVYPRASRNDLDEITALLRATFLDPMRESETPHAARPARKRA